MSPQTRSRRKEGFQKVLLNDLILANIFSNLTLDELLPFRLTCQTWRNSINGIISKDKVARFNIFRKTDHSNNDEIEHVRNLKIRKVVFDCWSPFTLKCQYNWVYEELIKCGSQMEYFKIVLPISVTSKTEVDYLKAFFKAFPNLKTFEAPLSINIALFIEEFQNFVYPSLRFLNLRGRSIQTDGDELFQQFFKIFPNLTTNFDNENLDNNLLKMMLDESNSQIKIRNYQSSKWLKDSGIIKFLIEIPSTSFPLKSLELLMTSELQPTVINKVLLNFAQSLVKVKLWTIGSLHGEDDVWYTEEICLPPLPKIRKLWLDMPLFNIRQKVFVFRWNLGKRMATDFPLLEYLILSRRFHGINENPKIVLDVTSCKVWECFVPFSQKQVDLSPLKYLKFVDLSFPKHWIGVEENREWCEKYLQLYEKLYGNGGKTMVMQELSGWLK